MDMDIEIVLKHKAILSPEEGQKLVAGEHAAGLLGKPVENAEFHHGQMHRDLGDSDAIPIGVDLEIADSLKISAVLGGGTASA
jgi:hypothetical protein